jgi:hypothetical protein
MPTHATSAAAADPHLQLILTSTGVRFCTKKLGIRYYHGGSSTKKLGASVCVLISFIYNLGLTIKPIKGPPLGVSACPHNDVPLVGLAPNVCVCVFNLSLSMTVVSPELWCCSSSWKRRSRTASDGGSSPGVNTIILCTILSN